MLSRHAAAVCIFDDDEKPEDVPATIVRKKERNPLQEGPLKGIGSSAGMQPYKGGVGINLGGTSN